MASTHAKETVLPVLSIALVLTIAGLYYCQIAVAQEYLTSEELIEKLSAPPAPRTRGLIKTPGTAAVSNEISNPSVLLNIHFGLNSSELSPQAMHQLNEVGEALNSATLGSFSFEVGGYTDATGDAAYNRNLAARRAMTVKQYLSSNFGVSPERLNTVGWGEDKPLIPDNPYHPDNRRVEIINLRQ